MKYKYYIIVLSFLIGFGVTYFAKGKNDDGPKIVIERFEFGHSNFLPYEQLKRRICESGDTVAYRLLIDSLSIDANVEYPIILFYSLVMLNSYNYLPAQKDVVDALLSIRDEFATNWDVDSLIQIYKQDI